MDNSFTYNYSSKEQEELNKIREKYIEKEKTESNLDKIKRLDKQPAKYATITALVIGIVFSLIMGTGMSLIMVANDFILGIIVGIIGLLGMLISYPVYRLVFNIVKKDIKDEIIQLCDKEIKK